MKEKLLKLIYLELKNLDTLKFHDLSYHGCNAGYESSYTTSWIDCFKMHPLMGAIISLYIIP
jgi:hypothetical protein